MTQGRVSRCGRGRREVSGDGLDGNPRAIGGAVQRPGAFRIPTRPVARDIGVTGDGLVGEGGTGCREHRTEADIAADRVEGVVGEVVQGGFHVDVAADGGHAGVSHGEAVDADISVDGAEGRPGITARDADLAVRRVGFEAASHVANLEVTTGAVDGDLPVEAGCVDVAVGGRDGDARRDVADAGVTAGGLDIDGRVVREGAWELDADVEVGIESHAEVLEVPFLGLEPFLQLGLDLFRDLPEGAADLPVRVNGDLVALDVDDDARFVVVPRVVAFSDDEDVGAVGGSNRDVTLAIGDGELEGRAGIDIDLAPGELVAVEGLQGGGFHGVSFP